MPAGMIKDDARNRQRQDGSGEEPSWAYGERHRQPGIETDRCKNRNESRPAWFTIELLNGALPMPKRLRVVLRHDSNSASAPDTITWPTIGLDSLSDLRARLLVQSGRELQLLERYPAKQTIGIAKGFWQFEVIVSLGDDQLYRLVGSLDCRCELLGLALKLGRLESPMRKDERCVQFVEMALSAQRLYDRISELDVLASFRECDGFEVVHAAHQDGALHNIHRKAEIFLPIRYQCNAGEMGSGGVAREVEMVWIAAHPSGISIDPCDGATHLIGQRHEISVGLFNRYEIDRDKDRAGRHEHFGRIGGVLRGAAAPRAAVDKDLDRCIAACSLVDVDMLDLRRTIGDALRLKASPCRFAPQHAPTADVGLVGCPDALIIRVIELFLVHVEPDTWSLGVQLLFECRACHDGSSARGTNSTVAIVLLISIS